MDDPAIVILGALVIYGGVRTAAAAAELGSDVHFYVNFQTRVHEDINRVAEAMEGCGRGVPPRAQRPSNRLCGGPDGHWFLR